MLLPSVSFLRKTCETCKSIRQWWRVFTLNATLFHTLIHLIHRFVWRLIIWKLGKGLYFKICFWLLLVYFLLLCCFWELLIAKIRSIHKIRVLVFLFPRQCWCRTIFLEGILWWSKLIDILNWILQPGLFFRWLDFFTLLRESLSLFILTMLRINRFTTLITNWHPI